MLGLLASSIVGLSASAGVGSSYDYAGVRVDLHVWHLAASVALGVSGVGLHDDATYGVRDVNVAPALGLRVYSGDRDGFVAAVTWSGHRYQRSYDERFLFDPTARMDIFTLTAGWRFLWSSGLFLEAAAGGGAAVQSAHPSLSGWNGNDSIPGPFQRRSWRIFDVALGVGYHF